jgi:hypothetical protein
MVISFRKLFYFYCGCILTLAYSEYAMKKSSVFEWYRHRYANFASTGQFRELNCRTFFNKNGVIDVSCFIRKSTFIRAPTCLCTVLREYLSTFAHHLIFFLFFALHAASSEYISHAYNFLYQALRQLNVLCVWS